MSTLLDLGNGKQIVVTSDERSPTIWLQLCANKGSLGVQLTKAEAIRLRTAIYSALLEMD